MHQGTELPAKNKIIAAVIPDIAEDENGQIVFLVNPAALRDIRANGHVPVIVPVHSHGQEIDLAAHAFIRWSFDYIHASEEIKEKLDSSPYMRAMKDFIDHKMETSRDLSAAIGDAVDHPSQNHVLDHLNPRVMVVPDFKDGIIRLSKRFIDALRQGSRVIPVIASGADYLHAEYDYVEASGILLPGSNSHYHPKHYGGAQDEPDSVYDLPRDELVKTAVEKAHEEDIPLFGICSGMQGIVVFGDTKGRLIPDLHAADRPGHHAARNLRTEEAFVDTVAAITSTRLAAVGLKKPARFTAAHSIHLAPGSFLTHLLNLTIKFRAANQKNIHHGFDVPVNSLHEQSIDETTLGDDLSVEAVAEDGTIEAIHSRRHKYIVGVQFHPEAAFMKDVPVGDKLEVALYRALFWSFGQAAHDRMWLKQITRRNGGGAWRNRGMAWIYMKVPGTIHMTPEFVTGGGFSGTSYHLEPRLWYN
jgi:gamma-glutamyl-gamma-aminobutyrate hydrolase PuuD